MPPTAFRVDSLSDFADGYLGYAEGAPFANAGPSCREVAAKADPMDVESLLSTMFWQVYTRSPAFADLLRDVELPERATDDERRQLGVLPHPLDGSSASRHDLVVFDQEFDKEEPATREVEVTEADLSAGWSALIPVVEEFRAIDPLSPMVLHLDHPNLAWEIYRRQLYGIDAEVREGSAPLVEQAYGRFGVLVAAMPELDPSSVPDPAWRTAPAGTDGVFATAGLIDRNEDGVLGVTIPHHVMVREPSTPVAPETPVDINGLVGYVVTDSIETDSCFVALPTVDEPQVGVISATSGTGGLTVRVARVESATYGVPSGVKTGQTPGQKELSNFVGALSGRGEARVQSWDPDVLIVMPGSRNKLFTDLKTGEGDSGAALVSAGDGRLLGFAHAVTPLGADPPMSSWIWAESVARAHRLSILNGSSSPGAL